MNKEQMRRDRLVYSYIIDAISWDGYDLEQELQTDLEKLMFLGKCFKSEYQHMIDRVGYQAAMAEWLAGLPSVFNIEYRNYEILKIAVEWESLPANATEAQQDRLLSNWFGYVASKTAKFIRRAERSQGGTK